MNEAAERPQWRAMTLARLRALVLGAFAVCAPMIAAPAASAQTGATSTAGTLAPPAAPNARPRPDAADRGVVVSTMVGAGSEREVEGVVARGSPRSFQIVSVPVPSAFAPSEPVSFEVLATGSATLLGARQGVLAPSAPGTPRTLSLTVGVAARALAGRERVAQVRFTATGQADIVTPVDLDVAPVRHVDILVTPALVAARAGRAVPIHYRLTNLGNAVDSVRVHVESIDPSPVKPVDGELVVLPVNAARDFEVAVRLPRSAPPSVIALEVRVVGADGDDRASAQASIEVVVATRGPGGNAPVLATSLALPLGVNDATPAVSMTMSGLLTTNLRVDGRWNYLGTTNPMAVTALTRLGYYDIAPSLGLTAPHWRTVAGASGVRLTDLTGSAAWGVGLSGTLDTATWRAGGVLAQPGVTHDDPTRGVLAGATVSHLIGADWVTASASHLVEDQQVFERRLDALSLGVLMPAAYDATIDAELAARHWDVGSGVGARMDIERRTTHDNASLRVLHAPGGSAAFAPSRDEVALNGARVLNPRWIVSGSGWWNADDGVAAQAMHSDGWSLQPQMMLSELTSVALRVRWSDFAMRGLGTSIATAERDVGAVLNTRRNTLYGSGSFAIGTRSRDSQNSFAAASFDEHITRSTTEATGGWTSAFGSFEVDATVERNLAGIGITPDRSLLGVRVDRIVVDPNWTGIYLNGSVQRTGWLGERQRATIASFALSAELRYSLRATLGLQHNSFFAPGDGRWTTVLSVERALTLPRLQRRRTGHVFEDLNGNGIRDEGEPGFAGAIVRSASTSVATGDDGRFRLPVTAHPPVIDSRSLPVGWLPGPTSAAAGAKSSDLAVVPTSAIEVELVPVVSSDGRKPRTDLSAADVMARDASGHLWMARIAPDGIAIFDALPPGDYRVELDLTRVKEPLTTRDALPTFSVQAAPSRRRYTVAIIPRPLKMWRPSQSPDASTSAAPPPTRPEMHP